MKENETVFGYMVSECMVRNLSSTNIISDRKIYTLGDAKKRVMEIAKSYLDSHTGWVEIGHNHTVTLLSDNGIVQIDITPVYVTDPVKEALLKA